VPEIHTPRPTLDGEPLAIAGVPKTLGDLLAVVDEACARRARIVTALRLDGAEEPAFREAHVVGRPLSTIETIDVESGTASELALSCLFEAGHALRSLAQAASELSVQIHIGNTRGAAADLAAIRQGIATVLTITGAASLGVGIDLTLYPTDHGTLHDSAERALCDLEAIVTAQLAGEWTTVADQLNPDLACSLARWGAVCGAIDLASHPPREGTRA
jgi:hypothetical protein